MHKRVSDRPCAASCYIERIQASDATGTHSLDSVTSATPAPVLTDLKLTGDVLSWRHAGTPRSTTLKP